MPRRLGLLAVAALVLPGCGSATTVRVGGHQLNLTLDEYRIQPMTVSVPPGPIRIVARNRGILTHDIAVELESGGVGSPSAILAASPTIMPGATGVLHVPALNPGRYGLASTVSNQADLGMIGTLTVR